MSWVLSMAFRESFLVREDCSCSRHASASAADFRVSRESSRMRAATNAGQERGIKVWETLFEPLLNHADLICRFDTGGDTKHGRQGRRRSHTG